MATPDGPAYRPLFAQQAVFSLKQADIGTELTRASGMGTDAQASLSAPLSREQALGVLAALAGSPSNLTTPCEVRYRVRVDPTTIRLDGAWAAVYDALAARPDATAIGWPALLRYFAALIGGGVIAARVETSTGGRPAAAAEVAAIFPRFLAMGAVILRRLTPDLAPQDPANVYGLRDRPDDWLRLNLRQTLGSTTDASITLAARLEEVLGRCLDGSDWGDYVHLIGPTGDLGGGLSPTPRRVRTGRAVMSQQLPMAAQPDRSLRSLSLMMRPVTAVPPSAAATVASDAASPAVAVGPATAHIPIGEIYIDPPDTEQLRNLPVVEDPASPVWHDRANPASYWYTPAFTVVQPAPTANPDTSPFLFSCVQTGATATGRGLDGTIRLTLIRSMSAATKAALPAGAQAQPVPLGNLAISLQVPFRDSGDGMTKTHDLTGTVQQTGDTLTVTVKVLDDWVKLSYAALAYPGIQPQPARLLVTYTYDAYVVVRQGSLNLGYGGKLAQIPIAESAVRSLAASPRLVASMAVRPDLEADGILTNFINRTHYAVQTFGRQEKVDVLFPCNTLGALYQLNGNSGCQDAFKLDQTVYKLYEEIKELKHPLYQVFRSLQQPGLFMVAPTSYRITRFGPADGASAYRPAIAVYAAIDLQAKPPTPTSQYVVKATLQPDVPPYVRRELRAKLEAYAQSPVIQFPTEVSSVPNYQWLVGAPVPCTST
jgi:hypothetical protein